MATVSEGVQAPDFKLTSTSDDTFSLMERRGSANLVLLFLDSASGGTDTQIAASFRDASEVFAAERTTVVGIAKATLDDLKAFQTTHSLPFELLSDDGAVAAAYGVRVRQGFGAPLPAYRANASAVAPSSWTASASSAASFATSTRANTSTTCWQRSTLISSSVGLTLFR